MDLDINQVTESLAERGFKCTWIMWPANKCHKDALGRTGPFSLIGDTDLATFFNRVFAGDCITFYRLWFKSHEILDFFRFALLLTIENSKDMNMKIKSLIFMIILSSVHKCLLSETLFLRSRRDILT